MPSIEDPEDLKYEDACVYHYIVEKKTAKHSRWRQVAIIRPSVDDDGHRIDINGSIPLKYTTDELFSDEIYVFRVFAVNEIGKSDPSHTYDIVTPASDDEFDEKIALTIARRLSISTEVLPLDVPSNIQVKTNDNTRVELCWNSVERAALYGVERRNLNDDEKMWLEIANTDRVKFIDRSILKTGKYVYRLTAKLPGVINSVKSLETPEVFIVAKPMRRHSASPPPISAENITRETQLYNTRRASGSLLTSSASVTTENDTQKIETPKLTSVSENFKQKKKKNLFEINLPKPVISVKDNQENKSMIELKEQDKVTFKSIEENEENKQIKKKKVIKKKATTSDTIESDSNTIAKPLKQKSKTDEEKKIELATDLPTEYTISEGESAELTIIWKKGMVDECLWWKDGKLLPTSQYTFESSRSICWIRLASASDAGNYKCQLKNINTGDIVLWDMNVNINS